MLFKSFLLRIIRGQKSGVRGQIFEEIKKYGILLITRHRGENSMDIICNNIALFLAKNCKSKGVSVEVYIYGMQLVISNIGIMLCILLTSCLVDSLGRGVLYLLAYIPLKVTCGGYHANTAARCFIYSIINYLLVVALAKVLTILEIRSFIWLLFLIVNIVYIAMNSPLKHYNHKVGEKTERKNKVFSFCILIVWLVILSIGYFAYEYNYTFNYIVLTIASVANGIIFTKARR